MNNLFRDQKGSVLVLTALTMVVIFGFAALVIDGGNLYHRNMRLQDIADACALAGAQEWAADSDSNKDEAIEKGFLYATLNDITLKGKVEDDEEDDDGDSEDNNEVIILMSEKQKITLGDDPGNMEIMLTDKNKVIVKMKVNTKNFFAGVLGSASSDVAVASVAQFGIVKNQKQGIYPFGLEQSAIEEAITAGGKLGLKTDKNNGNYGFLRIDGNGDNDLTASLKKGYTEKGVSIGEDINAKPGEALQMHKGGQELIDRFSCGCGTTSANYSDHKDNCPRFLIVAIVTDFGSGASEKVKVLAFTKLFLKEYEKDGNKVSIPAVTLVKQTDNVGELLDPNENQIDDTYLLKAVRLVE